jgi:hypothetical protein
MAPQTVQVIDRCSVSHAHVAHGRLDSPSGMGPREMKKPAQWRALGERTLFSRLIKSSHFQRSGCATAPDLFCATADEPLQLHVKPEDDNARMPVERPTPNGRHKQPIQRLAVAIRGRPSERKAHSSSFSQSQLESFTSSAAKRVGFSSGPNDRSG